MKYKYSKYNYFMPYKGSYVGMNFNSKILFALEKANYDLLQEYKHDITQLEKENKHLVSALYKLGILIGGSINELDVLRMKNRKAVYSGKYRLTILPTLSCNFNCWYCYETHAENQMTDKLMNTIEKHVLHMIENENISSLELDWFGGEPLICFDSVIYPLSKRILKIAENSKIDVTHIITTNGALATSHMIKKFDEIQLYNFQITLDGKKELHNKVKKDTNGGSYDRIVNTINSICKLVNNASVLLRINFTDENIKTIEEIIEDFPENNRNKIKLLFQQVWQHENKNNPIDIESKLSMFEKAGFHLEFNKFNRKSYGCYADRYYQSVITPDGSVFKCTARDFVNEETSEGRILEDGIIEWKEEKISQRLGKSTFENKHCLPCKFLPLCWGPCSQKIIELKKNNDLKFKQFCYKGGLKKGLDKVYRDFYNKTFES